MRCTFSSETLESLRPLLKLCSSLQFLVHWKLRKLWNPRNSSNLFSLELWKNFENSETPEIHQKGLKISLLNDYLHPSFSHLIWLSWGMLSSSNTLKLWSSEALNLKLWNSEARKLWTWNSATLNSETWTQALKLWNWNSETLKLWNSSS